MLCVENEVNQVEQQLDFFFLRAVFFLGSNSSLYLNNIFVIGKFANDSQNDIYKPVQSTSDKCCEMVSFVRMRHQNDFRFRKSLCFWLKKVI